MSLYLGREILKRFRGPRRRGGRGDDPRKSHRTLASPRMRAVEQTVACFALTDVGRVRERNEDHFFVADLRDGFLCSEGNAAPAAETMGCSVPNPNLLVVADGVGGNPGGQLASRLAVEGVVEYLRCRHGKLLNDQSDERVLDELQRALEWAHRRIACHTDNWPEYASMGTTLTLAYLLGSSVYIGHVGDSRAYLCRGGELVQLTHDQTFAQLLADAGVLDRSLVCRHPLSNVLGSVVCCDREQLIPQLAQADLRPGDWLLLCTDGLTKHVGSEKIVETLRAAISVEDACRRLVAAANRAGGTDNTTVVLSRVGAAENVGACAPRTPDSTVPRGVPPRLSR